ncbi:MAG: hypothetical protein ILO34_01135, partial [Kiritimatiellae bacterium]|nr:hypothetical protein [Kiritimatiellia bacterium]
MKNDFFECAPVLLIGFNRPDLIKGQIDAVRSALPKRLYIAADGPREHREGEAELCAAVRKCVGMVDWPCEVRTLFRNHNLGCKFGVSSAIAWFFENEEMGIILEDDCRPVDQFFRYATELLHRYRDDGRVGSISGFNHFNYQSNPNDSYHFSRHISIWGWATWRRAWSKYELDVRSYRDIYADALKKSELSRCSQRMRLRSFSGVASGLINTWDVQMSVIFFCNNLLTIVPKERLVVNLGIGALAATHTQGFNLYAKQFSTPGRIEFPLKHPNEVCPDSNADRRREMWIDGFFARCLTWVGDKFRYLRPVVLLLDRIAK